MGFSLRIAVGCLVSESLTANRSLVKATANVGSAAVLVSGGSVDGLLGGGIAFDNVNAKASNAVANTENVTITVTGGEINAANVDPITGYIQGEHSGVPNRDSHVHQVAKTLGKDGANVAILGGGVASGAGAESSTKDVNLKTRKTSLGRSSKARNLEKPL